MRRGSWNMTSYTHVTYPLVGNCVMWRITTREQVGVTAQRMLRSYGTRKSAMADSLAGNYAYFELPNALENVAQHNQSLALLLNNDDNDSSNGGQATAYQIQSTSNTQQQSYGRYIWYFHKDHLSSSTLITNGDGFITQQIDYLPYGEVFLEKQRNANDYLSPYKFNGKELDEETGLYYYGARYMNPRLSIWYATDPMQEKYPNITSYAYCAGNPVRFVDTTGKEVDLESFIYFETVNNLNYREQLVNDLSFESGLSIRINDSNRLEYEKDEKGNAVILLDNDGRELGSITAREHLMTIIDSEDVISLSGTIKGGSATSKNSIRLDVLQILSFINGSNNIDPRTLGFGMTFLHESLHTLVCGHLIDWKGSFGTGDVVDKMNIIRSELNDKGFDFGQRFHYKSQQIGDYQYIGFDKPSTGFIMSGIMPNSSKFIRF